MEGTHEVVRLNDVIAEFLLGKNTTLPNLTTSLSPFSFFREGKAGFLSSQAGSLSPTRTRPGC